MASEDPCPISVVLPLLELFLRLRRSESALLSLRLHLALERGQRDSLALLILLLFLLDRLLLGLLEPALRQIQTLQLLGIAAHAMHLLLLALRVDTSSCLLPRGHNRSEDNTTRLPTGASAALLEDIAVHDEGLEHVALVA